MSSGFLEMQLSTKGRCWFDLKMALPYADAVEGDGSLISKVCVRYSTEEREVEADAKSY